MIDFHNSAGNVGLSNRLDNELGENAPAERPCGETVGAAIAGGELLCKIARRVKRAAGIRTLLILGNPPKEIGKT